MKNTEELLKNTNPNEYNELIRFSPRWGNTRCSKDTLPNNSKDLGMWLCSSCNNTWVSTIQHRIYNNKYGCKICKNNSERNLKLKILNECIKWDVREVAIQIITTYNRKNGVVKKISEYSDDYNIDYFDNKFYFEDDDFSDDMLSHAEPELAQYWNNYYNIPANMFSIFSDDEIKYKWKCIKCNQTFEETLKHMRRNKNNPCPYCLGKFPSYKDSLAYRYPDIAKEIVENMNDKKAEHYFPESNESAVFKCSKCGIYVRKRIIDRINSKCEYCENGMTKEIIKTIYNGFVNLLPYEKYVNPQMIKTERYKCPICNVEQMVSVRDLFEQNYECRVCSNKEVLPGYNSLDIYYPEVAEEWSVNNIKNVSEYIYSSKHTVLWKCRTCNGEYKYRIFNKIADYEGNKCSCPYCNNLRPLKNYNTLNITHISICEEWDNLNNSLLCKKDEILANSNLKVWWRCKKCNNKYLMSPKEKVLYGTRNLESCIYCKGVRRKKFYYFPYK